MLGLLSKNIFQKTLFFLIF